MRYRKILKPEEWQGKKRKKRVIEPPNPRRMKRHHAIALAMALAVLVAGIFLSLIRSKSIQNPSGEIKHFSSKNIPKNSHPKTAQSSEQHAGDRARIEEHATRRSGHVGATTPPNQKSPQTAIQAGEKESGMANQPLEEPLFEEGVLITHTVTSGESLLGLAKRYRTTAYQIAKRNVIAEDAGLVVGQVLELIPGEEATYRVRQGKNLSQIAQRFGANRADIVALNDIKDGASIWVGQKLIMPVTQKEIDYVMHVLEEKKKQEKMMRKYQYQQQFVSRLKRLKNERRKQAILRASRAAKAKKSERARMAKARKKLKYASTAKYRHKMRVVATAYTSHRSQTDSTPFLAAWNNHIRPGMKIIAVSPDLIRKYGLTNGVRVKIGGLPGTYVVRDKMNARLHDHIDIYMGTNRRRALRWGRRRVVMYW